MIAVMSMLSNSKFVLPTRLRELSETRGIPFKVLSEKSGVPVKTLYGWTAGNQPRKMQDLKAVADCLCISVDELVFTPPPNAGQSPASLWIMMSREKLGLEVAEIAKRAELSIQEIIKYETQADVPVFIFLKLLKIYGHSEESILAKISEFYKL